MDKNIIQSGSAPIGFEGILPDQTQSLIGFEQYEIEQNESMASAYPLDDRMPNSEQLFQNNFSHYDSPSSSSSSLHSSNHDTNSHISTKKSLSYPQLFAIYNEIVNEWFKQHWLIFVDNHKETYLTLNSNANEFLTVQMTINQYNLASDKTLLRSQPECLLIRTQSNEKSLFLPNSIISLENLYDNNNSKKLFHYKLMAIICHSNETNTELMFYRDFSSNNWYVYYNQSISSHSHSNILSNEEQFQIESFIQQQNHIHLPKFTFPLSALYNHPIVYVYIPEKNNEKIQKI